MPEQSNNSIHIRFTAYLNIAIRNRRIKYMMQRKSDKLLDMEELDLQESLHLSFEEQYHAYLMEKTEYLMEDWKRFREFMELLEDRKLARALKHLKECDRMILFARLFGEESFSEIGEMLQMSSKQAEMSYYYVLRKLRKELEADKNGF